MDRSSTSSTTKLSIISLHLSTLDDHNIMILFKPTPCRLEFGGAGIIKAEGGRWENTIGLGIMASHVTPVTPPIRTRPPT